MTLMATRMIGNRELRLNEDTSSSARTTCLDSSAIVFAFLGVLQTAAWSVTPIAQDSTPVRFGIRQDLQAALQPARSGAALRAYRSGLERVFTTPGSERPCAELEISPEGLEFIKAKRLNAAVSMAAKWLRTGPLRSFDIEFLPGSEPGEELLGFRVKSSLNHEEFRERVRLLRDHLRTTGQSRACSYLAFFQREPACDETHRIS